MHRTFCEQLLSEELAYANGRPVRGRLTDDLRLEGTTVLADVAQGGSRYRLALSGENYNAEPFSLSVRDPDTDVVLDAAGWPGSLNGGIHPVTAAPFCCIRGVAEYYIHPSHLQDRWDQHRGALRLDVLLTHILNKMGVAP